jgi:ATP-dependent DNA helicase PIF1
LYNLLKFEISIYVIIDEKMSLSKTKYYAIIKGHNPGIYTDWTTTNENVKGFAGAIYESFKTMEEAQEYIDKYNSSNSSNPDIPITNQLDTLTNEQLSVINLLLQDKNVFLTGGGGVGKSYLLSAIYTELPGLKHRLSKKKNPELVSKLPRIQMCALTGCAALLLGHKAKTLHSWAGIGLGKESVSELYVKISRNRKAKRNWLCTDLLIIDEISMMTADLFDKLDSLGKKIRSNKKPFGGIQLLLVGDFFQLPPVTKGDDSVKFAFESEAWPTAITSSVELTIIQRQKDEAFQKILKEARTGALSKESVKVLNERQGREWKENKIRPTLLFPRRAEVDMINDTNLKALQGRKYTYKARIVHDGKAPNGFTETDEAFQKALAVFDSGASYSKELVLMLDAQVMLIANTNPNEGLVNGSRGVVTGFCSYSELPIVEFVNGAKKTIGSHTWPIEDYEFVSRSQIPLQLAFAVTTHKSQGATLDSALVDIGSGIFEYGQAYVALSRVRSLEALYVHDFDKTAFRAHPKVKQFYSKLLTKTDCEDVLSGLRVDEDLVTDSKTILAEPSRTIAAVKVVKLDALEPGNTDNWLYTSIPAGWRSTLEPCQEKLLELSTLLAKKEFLPSKEHIWRALELTAIESIKVVILGQDPYPGAGNAHGLAFSVLPDVKKIPASLQNIYKELVSDVGFTKPSHGNLESWANQGVFLLNTVLTVEEGAPQSHSKIGWEEITDQIIRSIAAKSEKIIFVLWGKSAQAKKKLLQLYLDKNSHRVLESAHPSPLSAHRGFFNSKPFSTINGVLGEMGKGTINWQI